MTLGPAKYESIFCTRAHSRCPNEHDPADSPLTMEMRADWQLSSDCQSSVVDSKLSTSARTIKTGDSHGCTGKISPATSTAE